MIWLWMLLVWLAVAFGLGLMLTHFLGFVPKEDDRP